MENMPLFVALLGLCVSVLVLAVAFMKMYLSEKEKADKAEKESQKHWNMLLESRQNAEKLMFQRYDSTHERMLKMAIAKIEKLESKE